MSQTELPTIAILIADGLISEPLLEKLAARGFPESQLNLLGIGDSLGERIFYAGRDLALLDAEQFDFSAVDYLLIDALREPVADIANRAGAAACDVCLLGGLPRTALADDWDPLILEEPAVLAITRLQAQITVHPFARLRIQHFLSASALGRHAVEELAQQTRALLTFNEPKTNAFPLQIAFNLIPDIDGGVSARICEQLQKRLVEFNVSVNACSAFLPLLYGEALHIQLDSDKPISVDEFSETALAQQRVALHQNSEWSSPVTHATGQDSLILTQLQPVNGVEHGIQCWIYYDAARILAEEVLKQWAICDDET